jgi:hypothetical protein
VAPTTNRTDIAGIFIPDLIKVDLSTGPARLAGAVRPIRPIQTTRLFASRHLRRRHARQPVQAALAAALCRWDGRTAVDSVTTYSTSP